MCRGWRAGVEADRDDALGWPGSGAAGAAFGAVAAVGGAAWVVLRHGGGIGGA